MELFAFFFRTVLMYFIVYIVFRIMGKREIGKLSVFDLVISIMIAEIAVFILEDISKPIYEGLIPMLTLVLIQVLIAYVSLKSHKVRKMFDEQPSIIINKGKLDRNEMSKQRYSLTDLLLQLRENKVSNIADVEFAILEPTGKLTVVTQKDLDNASSVQSNNEDTNSNTNSNNSGNNSSESHVKIARSNPSQNSSDSKPKIKPTKIRFEGLPYSLIMDGKVQDENLTKIGKTRFWLKNELQSQGIKDFKEVFYCSIDHRGQLYIDKK